MPTVVRDEDARAGRAHQVEFEERGRGEGAKPPSQWGVPPGAPGRWRSHSHSPRRRVEAAPFLLFVKGSGFRNGITVSVRSRRHYA